MNSVPRIALGFALALGSGLVAGTPAAFAQEERVITLTEQERNAIQALKTALESRNYAVATSALATAQSAAQSGYARYLASALQLRLALETKNYGLQKTAIEAMINSGAAPASALPELYKSQGALAMSAGEYEKAEAAFTRWTQVAPNDPEAFLALAEVKNVRKNVSEAVTLIDHAIKLQTTAGRPVPESWYKRGLKHAFDARMVPQSIAFSGGLVAAYPAPENWRDALLVRRDLGQMDAAALVDLMRLLRGTDGLAGERDYYTAAEALISAGLGAEAKALIDEGVAANMVDPAEGKTKELLAAAKKAETGLKGLEAKAQAAATGETAVNAADAHFGHAEYAKAAALYRTALEKGSVDPNLVNTRLGISLGLAGQKAEAETALRAVTGPRADLASLWLLWLSQRAPAPAAAPAASSPATS
jgi:tetratricopeptide (TPR) repeat protein